MSTNESEQKPVETRAASNVIVDYFKEIFLPVHVDEFLESLDDAQKKFISHFCLGFEACLGHSIIGVYAMDYIKSKNLSNDLLKAIGVNCLLFDVNDIGLKFAIVWQWQKIEPKDGETA